MKRRWLYLLGILLLPSLAFGSEELRFKDRLITPEELARLEKGEILVWKNAKNLLGGTGIGLIQAPPENVWRVIVDYPEHPKFLPAVVKSDILQEKENALVLHTEYKTPWPFPHVYMIMDVTHEILQPEEWVMSFIATQTNLKTGSGGWIVRPYKNGSLIFYEMNFDVHYLPQVLAAGLARKGMRYILNAMKTRALNPAPEPKTYGSK